MGVRVSVGVGVFVSDGVVGIGWLRLVGSLKL